MSISWVPGLAAVASQSRLVAPANAAAVLSLKSRKPCWKSAIWLAELGVPLAMNFWAVSVLAMVTGWSAITPVNRSRKSFHQLACT